MIETHLRSPRVRARGCRVWALLAALLLGCTGGSDAQGFAPFSSVSLTVDFDVDGQGTNVDSIAFYEAPDPTETLMFVTAKSGDLLEVWQYPFLGNEFAPLMDTSFGDSDTNGVAVDVASSLLYVTVPASESTAAVFTLPGLSFVREFIAGAVDLGDEPNIAILHHSDGSSRSYVSADFVVYMHDTDSGADLGSFVPEKGLETIAADDYHQALYIPDENDRTGVYAYDPDGNPFLRQGTNLFGAGIFDSDAEGIVIYTCPANGSGDDGRGWIVVSDQLAGQTEFEFFDRQTWQHLGTLLLDGVNNTDGIASTQRSLPAYPLGLFAAIDDDTSAVGIGWHRIIAATGLGCGATRPDGGRVPDGKTAPGSQLTVNESENGQLSLAWEASCVSGNDYAVYEGEIDGTFTNHLPSTCTTGAATSATISPAAGNRYYLVVPQGTILEGSYGSDSGLLGRSQSVASCLPRDPGGYCEGCGDDIRQDPEVCDGSYLDRQDCVGLGFESGVLTCEATCDGFDTLGCALCGNDRCEIFAREDCESRPADCNGELHGNKSDRYCCGDGSEYPVDCSDPRCSVSGNTCSQ